MQHNHVVALLALALTVTAPGARDPAPISHTGRGDEPRRPLVLVVHGRGQLARDTGTVRREALEALHFGARAVLGDSLLEDGDVRLVWYADVLDPRANRRGAARVTICSDDEIVAPRSDESGAAVFSLLAQLAGALLDADTTTQGSSGAEDLRALTSDLRYLGDLRTRCAAERRLASALEQARTERRPVVLVAHSLGALVSWGYLRSAKPDVAAIPEIRRLVTVGSPLGSIEVRQLVFGDEQSVAVPRGVGDWVNVLNEDDPFAVRLTAAADSTRSPRTGVNRIADVFTTRGGEFPHQFRRYLIDPVTTRAVLGAWCDAFGDDGQGAPPKGCGALRSSRARE